MTQWKFLEEEKNWAKEKKKGLAKTKTIPEIRFSACPIIILESINNPFDFLIFFFFFLSLIDFTQLIIELELLFSFHHTLFSFSFCSLFYFIYLLFRIQIWNTGSHKIPFIKLKKSVATLEISITKTNGRPNFCPCNISFIHSLLLLFWSKNLTVH